MQVVPAVDAIFSPLTGIGRYAFEPATRHRRSKGWNRCAALRCGDRRLRTRRFAACNHRIADGAGVVRPTSATGRREAMRSQRRRHRFRGLAPPSAGPRTPVRLSLPELLPVELRRPMGNHRAWSGDLSPFRRASAARRRCFDMAFERSPRHADAPIADSETVRQELIAEFSVAPDRVTANPLGVDEALRPHTNDELQPVLPRHGPQASSVR